MITIREIADNNTAISSTRWAFAAVIKADLTIVFITLAAGLVGHFIGKPLDERIYDYVKSALGIITGILAVVKAAQGFEPRHTKKEPKEEEQ
ncbi:MAG: hypothetical protein J6V90_08385 [Treponema sp.]|nr:hypothetical protein [Treponema sp.]